MTLLCSADLFYEFWNERHHGKNTRRTCEMYPFRGGDTRLDLMMAQQVFGRVCRTPDIEGITSRVRLARQSRGSHACFPMTHSSLAQPKSPVGHKDKTESAFPGLKSLGLHLSTYQMFKPPDRHNCSISLFLQIATNFLSGPR